ncbi:MAG: hypothetical protein J5676_01215 [Bacteroidaceae bacterium]|nr:hypothetical protein [Bacteroidaceae bacterium]
MREERKTIVVIIHLKQNILKMLVVQQRTNTKKGKRENQKIKVMKRGM